MKKYFIPLINSLNCLCFYIFLSLPLFLDINQNKVIYSYQVLTSLTLTQQNYEFYKFCIVFNIFLTNFIMILCSTILFKQTNIIKTKINYYLLNKLCLVMSLIFNILTFTSLLAIKAQILSLQIHFCFYIYLSINIILTSLVLFNNKQ